MDGKSFSPFVAPLSYALSLAPSELKDLIHSHKVFVIKQDKFSLDLFIDLMKRLGQPINHALKQFSLPKHRYVVRVSNLYNGNTPLGIHEGGTYWHTDLSYSEDIYNFTALGSFSVPHLEVSATEFIDCQAGYRIFLESNLCKTIGKTIKIEGIDNLNVQHVFGNRDKNRRVNPGSQEISLIDETTQQPKTLHPLILKHPKTSKKSFYGVAATSTSIEGLRQEDSLFLLDAIFKFLIESAPRYTHIYESGDIIIWDNVSLMHKGTKTSKSENPKNCRILYRMNIGYQ